MADSKIYQLFFIQSPRFFKGITLFELENKVITIPENSAKGYFIPDIGNGESGFILKDEVLFCPSIAESIPPSHCDILISKQSFSSNGNEPKNSTDIGKVYTEKNIHFQQLRIPIQNFSISRFVCIDRLKGYEIYDLENPGLEIQDNKSFFKIELSHVPPGFYNAQITLDNNSVIDIKFIKLFPANIIEQYLPIATNKLEEKRTRIENRQNLDSILDDIDASSVNIGSYSFSPGVLNLALVLKTEWGENYNQPIDERILKFYPDLSAEEIECLTKYSGEVESYIYYLSEQEFNKEIYESDILLFAKAKYEWLSDENLYRLKNIGMFYARK